TSATSNSAATATNSAAKSVSRTASFGNKDTGSQLGSVQEQTRPGSGLSRPPIQKENSFEEPMYDDQSVGFPRSGAPDTSQPPPPYRDRGFTISVMTPAQKCTGQQQATLHHQ